MPIGIGLNICNSCAPMHAAGVEVLSAGPNGGASFREGGEDASPWLGLAEIEVEDDSAAECDLSVAGLSNSVVVTDFGFAIPGGKTIVGVKVEIKRSRADGGGACKDATVMLVASGFPTGNNKAAATTWPTASAFASYGGSSDLWGAALSPSVLNSGDFGVLIQARDAGQLDTAQIDYVRMTVYYST